MRTAHDGDPGEDVRRQQGRVGPQTLEGPQDAAFGGFAMSLDDTSFLLGIFTGAFLVLTFDVLITLALRRWQHAL